MKITDVVCAKTTVSVSELIRISFRIEGAIAPFTFPFSNESVTKPVIEFIKTKEE